MDFCNPGLLGTQAAFREAFTVPIERLQDDEAAARLRRVTRPFVLRRKKTDPTIAPDLPDKVEVEEHCRLTREQGSLYGAVVEDMLQRVEETDGIERRGLVLQTMLRGDGGQLGPVGAFDDDPFLILTWRGRPREVLLDNLRALRGTEVPAASADRDDPWALLEQTDHPALSERLDEFWQAGPALAELRLSPSEPRPPDASVRSLDPLERDVGGQAIVEVLRPAYEAITTGARAQLLSSDDDTA
jgi:hypothetical protein